MPIRAFISRPARRQPYVRPELVLLLIILAGLNLGCSKTKTPRIEFPVTGVVIVADQPLTHGAITFIPEIAEEQGGRPGMAKLLPDGTFCVGNANVKPVPGLQAGKYQVTILNSMNPSSASNGGATKVRMDQQWTRLADWQQTPISVNIEQGTTHLEIRLADSGEVVGFTSTKK